HLDGDRLSGGWHLVRMRKRPGEKRNNWLLIKMDDDAARTAKDKDILEQNMRSVVSGRTMDQIAKGKAVWKSSRSKTALQTKAAVRRSGKHAGALPGFI